MTDGISFLDCVRVCLADRDFLSEYDRLRGTNLASVVNLEARVKESGDTSKEFRELFDFIKERVWETLPSS